MLLTILLAWLVTSLALSLWFGPAYLQETEELSTDELISWWSRNEYDR